MNGILCIDKPSGLTSFDVVAIMRRLTGERKVGHAGTLDPIATGVMPVFFGRATKTLELLPCHDKRYTAGIKLGVKTDTGDITGNIISRKEVHVGKSDLSRLLPEFEGEITQVPPMYSALKVNGRKLYDMARKGMEIERAPRKIHIYSIRLLHADESGNEYILDVFCSGGTYIRTLCEDIGERLGCGATMSSLRRTMAAGYSLADCITVDEAKRLAEEEKLKEKIQNVESIFIKYPEITVTDKQVFRFINGGALSVSRIDNCPAQGFCRVKTGKGLFIGLGLVCEDGELKPKWIVRDSESPK